MDPVELELDPAIAGSLMEAAHRQRRSVKRGDAVKTVMQCSGDGDDGGGGGASHHWLHPSLDQV